MNREIIRTALFVPGDRPDRAQAGISNTGLNQTTTTGALTIADRISLAGRDTPSLAASAANASASRVSA